LNCPGTGSISAILEATDQLAATVCVGPNPVFAWIYYDQSKVFVLDYAGSEVYVVNATSYQRTNIIPLPGGSGPFKVAQSNTGQYIYVLNSDGTISVIDGLNETVVQTVQLDAGGAGNCGAVCSAAPVDIAQDPNFNDTSTNTQINHVWVLHSDGTVSVWDGTTPGKLTWITAVQTITPAQAAAPTLAYPTNLALMRDGTYAYVGVGNTDQVVGINTSQLAEAGTVTLGVNPCPGGVTCSGIPATTSIMVGVHRGTPDIPLTWSLMDTVINQTTSTTTTYGPLTWKVEVTTPTVTSVAVSREGANTGTTGYSADLSKVYATTSTNTIYYCYNYQAQPVDCSDSNGEVWTNGQALTNADGAIDGIQATTYVTSAAPVPQGPAFIPGPQCTDIGLISSGAAAGLYGMSCPNLYAGTSVVTAAASGTTPINSYVTTIPAPSVVTYCSPGNPATGEFDGQKNCPVMTPVMVLGRS
jgi:hypothetical protein